MGLDDFSDQLRGLGFEVERIGPDRVVFPYLIEVGPRVDDLIRLGFVVPGDYNLSCPSGPHVSPRLFPNQSGGLHPTGGIHDSDFGPDWLVGVGGGSAMDAAKAAWVPYERPDLQPGAISPALRLDLRRKARLATVPTTSGTGSEVTMGIVLTGTQGKRKLGLGNRENVADIAIVDPALAASMPPGLTAETGLDALVHAVEAYTCTWHNDLADGHALRAPRFGLATADGPEFETVAALGSLLLIDDLETVIYAGHLCNAYGLDTISCGSTIGLACELFARGLVAAADFGGVEIRYGDAERLPKLVQATAEREGPGAMLALGSRALAERFGVPELAGLESGDGSAGRLDSRPG